MCILTPRSLFFGLCRPFLILVHLYVSVSKTIFMPTAMLFSYPAGQESVDDITELGKLD